MKIPSVLKTALIAIVAVYIYRNFIGPRIGFNI